MKRTQHNNLVLSYAKALFYVSKNKLDSIREEVQFLLDFLENQRDIFFRCISNPMIPLSLKKEVLLSINKNLSGNLVNFIMVISANRRSHFLILILKKFLNLVREDKNELEITIKSAEPLKENEVRIITESLNFLGKITKVSNVVDPSILGGFIIRYGFNFIDASLKNYLDRLVDLSRIEILKIRNIL